MTTHEEVVAAELILERARRRWCASLSAEDRVTWMAARAEYRRLLRSRDITARAEMKGYFFHGESEN